MRLARSSAADEPPAAEPHQPRQAAAASEAAASAVRALARATAMAEPHGGGVGPGGGRHRQKQARRLAAEARLLHREWQGCPAASRLRGEESRELQRAVEVSRMHERAFAEPAAAKQG